MTAPWGCDAADTFQFQTLDHRNYRSPTDTLLMYAAGAVAVSQRGPMEGNTTLLELGSFIDSSERNR